MYEIVHDLKLVEGLKMYGFELEKILNILENVEYSLYKLHYVANGRCKHTDINLNGSTFFCNKCNRTIFQFCPLCGSTKIAHSRFSIECPECDAVLGYKFL